MPAGKGSPGAAAENVRSRKSGLHPLGVWWIAYHYRLGRRSTRQGCYRIDRRADVAGGRL